METAPPEHRPAAPAKRRNTERYMYMAMFVDLLHMPLVIGLIVLGATGFPIPYFVGIVTAVVILQVALLGCPCMLLSGWLRRKHDPSIEPRWSVTVWLYQRYGPLVGIGVFVFFLVAAIAARALIV